MKKVNRVRKKFFLGSAAAGVALSAAAPYTADAYFSPPTKKKVSIHTKQTLRFGSRGQAVARIQISLREKDFYNINVDGIYGSATQSAVIRYQQAKKLRVDGITGSKTSSSLFSAEGHYVPADKLVQTGDRGQAVRFIQTELKRLNDYTYKIDGIFGPRTKKAVKQFQSDNGLQIDGIVGSQTRAALFDGDHKKSSHSISHTSSKKSHQTTSVSKKVKTSNVHTSAGNSQLMNDAKSLIGTPYQWGGTQPGGFDCSGFVQYVFDKNGINLPRTVSAIWNYGIPVSSPQKGDLVFFETYKAGPSHVGIYLGNGEFLSGTDDGVTVSEMDLDYWESRYLGAKRITQSN